MKKVICLSTLLLMGRAYAFSASDVRPISELQLMNDSELASEASKACSAMTIRYKVMSDSNRPEYERIEPKASEYLLTVGLVVRQKNNGHYPNWYGDMLTASQGKDPAACLAVDHKNFEEKLKRLEEESAKGTSTEENSTKKKK